MYLILLGAPGTGKGTQANILAERFGWPHISTGDLLREARDKGTSLGLQAKQYMDAGALVPDEVVFGLLKERLAQTDAQAGFILDGFPRNLAQAKSLDEALASDGKSINVAIVFEVPDDELVRRLSGRWVCRNCGAIYQQDSNPPRVPGKCDKCGGELYQRDDDRPDTVRARLKQQKPPEEMLEHYAKRGKLFYIDGNLPLDQVTATLLHAVSEVPGQAWP